MTNLKELLIKLQKSKCWILFILSLVLLIFGLTISIVFYNVLRDSNYTLADSAQLVYLKLVISVILLVVLLEQFCLLQV